MSTLATTTTTTAMMMMTSLPLPAELVEHILYLLWSSPLSAKERTDLLCTLPRTAHPLRTIFARVSETDVHVLTTTHAASVVRSIVTGRSDLRRCRTLTLSMLADPACFPDVDRRMRAAATLHAVLYVAYSAGCFPRLGVVTLDLRALHAADVRSHLPVLSLPSSVHTLNIALAPCASPRPVPNGRLAPPAPTYLRHGFTGWHTAHLRTLILDTPTAFADDLSRACISLRTLVLAWPGASARWWETLVPLRPSVGTLVLDIGYASVSLRAGLDRLAATLLACRRVFTQGTGTIVVEMEGDTSQCLPKDWEKICTEAHTRGLELFVRNK